MTSRKDSKLNGEKLEATQYNFPEFARGPAPKRKILEYLYEPKTGQILCRLPSSWGKLIIFYLGFYIVLSALFAICLQVLFCTLNDQHPKWKLDKSIIGTNPGLGFRPISNETEHGSLIWYNASDTKHINIWNNFTLEFLEPYINASETIIEDDNKRPKICTYEMKKNKSDVCSIPMDMFGDCIKENYFGYKDKSPCIFLKLNKIYGWEPDYFDDPNDLPKGMPKDLQDYIKTLKGLELRQVWVSCRGENPSDAEAMPFENIEYNPRGFPGYYYPYENQKGYLSPLVAVKFKNPEKHRLINIECRAWAKNIKYSGSYRDRQGSIHFELMIDTYEPKIKNNTII